MCDSPAAIVSRLAFNPLAMSPVVLCGWSLRYSTMRPSTSSLCARAVARRLLARRAVARRVERWGTTGDVTGVESGDRGVGARATVRCVCIAEASCPSGGAARREREGDPAREPVARPCGSPSWPRAPRLGAVARRWLSLRGLKSWPAGSAQLLTVLPFRADSSRVTQSHASPRAHGESLETAGRPAVAGLLH